jgi:hypothetical protein
MLSLYSEPYSATGSIDARAARRALGTTRMGFWDLFLREVLQNSWDARPYPRSKIGFTVDAYQLTKHQLRVLQEQIFTAFPIRGLPLRDALQAGPVGLLVVSDTGTRGLGGPIRADLQPHPGERTDFVDFVRNIGRATDKGMGGGTYGFGKGVLFDASMARTILAYSRTNVQGIPSTRLIGMALGEDYNDKGKRYTGRHWWGISDAHTGASPLEGRQADEMAAALGINRLRSNLTGTAIAVICPEEPDGPDQPGVVAQIAAAAMRWAWPHMIGDSGAPTIRFDFSENGTVVEAPDPGKHPQLRFYVEAYKRAQESLGTESAAGEWPWTQKLISTQQPKKSLGALAYRRLMSQAHSAGDYSPDAGVGGIALMRDPRFVVKYLTVSRGSQEQEVAGVFIADPSLDEEFARAEPVAHDDWLPSRLQLAKYQRNPVKQALDKLRAEFQAWRNAGAVAGPGEEHVSVTRVASLFGALLEGISGVDAAVPAPAGPAGQENNRLGQVGGSASAGSGAPVGDSARGDQIPGGGTRSPARRHSVGGSAWVAGPPALGLHNGHIRARFDVIARVGTEPMVIEAEPRVVLDSGAAEIAKDAPLGADTPRVAGWSEPAARRYTSSASIYLAGEGEHKLQVDIHQPADTMIVLALRTGPAQ